jgi:ribosomal protein uS11
VAGRKKPPPRNNFLFIAISPIKKNYGATNQKNQQKKQKKNIPTGVAHIQSTFNNTIVTIADTKGDVISWASAGSSGFKGAKKGTPFAAQTAADNAARRAIEQGMRQLEVMVSGLGRTEKPQSGPARSRIRNHPDPGRDSHPPQWLSSSQTPESVNSEQLFQVTGILSQQPLAFGASAGESGRQRPSAQKTER